MYRSHTCGELRKKDSGADVTLAGWVARVRDLGGLIFLDLRDRYGKTQVVFDPSDDEDLARQAKRLRAEWVVRIEGKVRARPEEMVNRERSTGEIEVEGRRIEVLSDCETPPRLPYPMLPYVAPLAGARIETRRPRCYRS